MAKSSTFRSFARIDTYRRCEAARKRAEKQAAKDFATAAKKLAEELQRQQASSVPPLPEVERR
jgi:predicted secreted protein